MDIEAERKTYFAKADYRGKERTFGIKAADRSKHMYVIGKTGMGKSVLLENMAAQDIQNGNGMAFIDPHGEAAETLLNYVPEDRMKDVVYFAPFDMDHPISFNVMEDVGYDKRHLVASGLMSAFKKIWVDTWSARMEYILTNTLLALLEYPDSTLLDVNRMLVNKDFRKDVVNHITDPIVKSFWVEEFARFTDTYTREATPAIQNKVGQFVANPLIRNIIGQPKSSFDFRKVMDEKKILIMNLSKGRMGDVNTKLLGSMLIIKIYLAAMSRADTPATELAKLPFFYFFVDEFQSFANETFADILSESRKYKLSLTIAHQYIGQMPDEVREAVFGNVGTMISFRIGAEDAEIFEKEFSPTFTAEDMVSLGRYQIYLKLMIDGLASKPFSATTLPPLAHPPISSKNAVIENSRKMYAHPRVEVEEQIKKRHITEVVAPKETGKADAKGILPHKPAGVSYAPRQERGEPRDGRGEPRLPRGEFGDKRPHVRTEAGRPYTPGAVSPRGDERRTGFGDTTQRQLPRSDNHPVREQHGAPAYPHRGQSENQGVAHGGEHRHVPFKRAFQELREKPVPSDRFPHREHGQNNEPTPKGGASGTREFSSNHRPAHQSSSGDRKDTPISLKMLHGNNKGPLEQKSENTAELRRVLQEALGKKDNGNPAATPKESAPPKEKAPTDTPLRENKGGAPREIPEDELKKMLGIEGDNTA